MRDNERRVTLFLDESLADRLKDEAYRRNRKSPSQSDVVAEALARFLEDGPPARPVTRRSLASA